MAKAATEAAVLAELAKGLPSLLVRTEVERWPLGLLALDRALGGGLPAGRIVEGHGPNDSGKTTLALEVARDVLDFHRGKRKILYQDHEVALDIAYGERILRRPIGVVDRLKDLPAMWRAHEVLLFRPRSFEADDLVTRKLVGTGKVAMVVHDSIPSMVPELEDEDDGLSPPPALVARALGTWLPRYRRLLSARRCVAWLVNHAKKQSIGYRGKEQFRPWVPSGGENPRFWSDVRLLIVGSRSPVYPERGRLVRVRVIKNKTASERRAEVPYHVDGRDGIDRAQEAIELLAEARKGRWVERKEGRLFEAEGLKAPLSAVDLRRLLDGEEGRGWLRGVLGVKEA